MNIYEALKKSPVAKRQIWTSFYIDISQGKKLKILPDDLLAEDWIPIYNPLTFDRIKKECTPNKTIFINEGGREIYYLGFNRTERQLVFDDNGFVRAHTENELDVTNWQISKEKWE